MDYDEGVVVRGTNVSFDDYVVPFPIRAQAHAFAWVMVVSRRGLFMLAEPEEYASTATGFACEVGPEEIAP